MKIFVLNCGGSSVKFKLLEMPEEKTIASGGVERLGKEDAVFHYKEKDADKETITLPVQNHKQGIDLILDKLVDKTSNVINDIKEIDAVGHRVVHAGERFTGSVPITSEVITALKDCYELAPLHNPPNVTGIEICQDLLPDTPMVAVFDNAFHAEIKDYVRTYAIPYEYYEKYSVRRYGFHGITFRYMTGKASELLDKNLKDLKIVSLMMGSGCTANAFDCGKSVEVSTGFTPLEGLIQSTRSGDVDPAAVLHIMRKENLSADEMDMILNKKSGWLGISGVSNDLREIVEAGNKGNYRANLALDAVVHRAKKYVGAYAAAMGGIDALVFSGGVGENSSIIRREICNGLEFLGITIDQEINDSFKGEGPISTTDSDVKVLVVETDEELVIARDTYKLTQN